VEDAVKGDVDYEEAFDWEAEQTRFTQSSRRRCASTLWMGSYRTKRPGLNWL
jgi:hypothetical protein